MEHRVCNLALGATALSRSEPQQLLILCVWVCVCLFSQLLILCVYVCMCVYVCCDSFWSCLCVFLCVSALHHWSRRQTDSEPESQRDREPEIEPEREPERDRATDREITGTEGGTFVSLCNSAFNSPKVCTVHVCITYVWCVSLTDWKMLACLAVSLNVKD